MNEKEREAFEIAYNNSQNEFIVMRADFRKGWDAALEHARSGEAVAITTVAQIEAMKNGHSWTIIARDPNFVRFPKDDDVKLFTRSQPDFARNEEPIYIVGKGWQCDSMPPDGTKLFIYYQHSPVENENKWQPIKTAPKDGTWVLVWSKHWSEYEDIDEDDQIRPISAQWTTENLFSGGEKTGRWQFARFDGGYLGQLRRKPPTHWMPLPKPPQG
jgi:hypothetical protein